MSRSSVPPSPSDAPRGPVPVRGSYRQPPRAHRVGAAHEKDVITVTLELRRQHALPSFGFSPELTPLTKRSERIAFGEKYGAGEEDIATVEDFARENHLEVVEKSAEKRRLRVSGSVARLQSIFGVKLSRYQPPGGGAEFRARHGTISLPPQLAPIVTSVQGLDRRPFARSHARLGRRAPVVSLPPPVFGDPHDPFARGFTGRDLASLYQFPAGTTGRGQTIGIIQLGGAIDVAEIARYFEEIGVLRDPGDLIVKNHLSREPGDEPGADLEVALDVEVAGAAAPGAKIVVYFAEDKTHEGFRNVLLDAIHDTEHCPTILTISWGGPENETTGQYRQSFREALVTARRFGITVIAAAGDYGSADHRFNDAAWDGHAHVDHPASDPLVLACGGTELQRDGTRPNHFSEVAWSVGRNHGTGGGVSRIFSLPDYQSTAGVPAARNPRGPVRRGVPDVAANASGESGYLVLCHGQWFPDYTQGVPRVSGTSAVAPLWAALVARLNEALGEAPPLGFIQSRLYDLPPNSGAFVAITEGNNGDYEAGEGWNACAGLGVPNGERLLEALRTHSARPASFVRVQRPSPVETVEARESSPPLLVRELRDLLPVVPVGRGLSRNSLVGLETHGGGDPGGSNVAAGLEVRGGGDPGGSNFAGGGDPGGSNFAGLEVRGGGDPGGSNFSGGGDPGGSNVLGADLTAGNGFGQLEPHGGGDPGGSNFATLEPHGGGDPGGSNFAELEPRGGGDPGGSNLLEPRGGGDPGGSN